MADPYEVAVYGEEANRLAAEIKELIERELAGITNPVIKTVMAAATLGTAAQLLDGERFKVTGVTGSLTSVIAGWLKGL